MRVSALIHYRVFAIPIFERDQYGHVQMSEKLGGRTRVWRRKLLRKVEEWQDVVKCTRLVSLRKEKKDELVKERCGRKTSYAPGKHVREAKLWRMKERRLLF